MTTQANPGKHWLYQWMDEYDATSEDAVADRLKYPGPVSRLQELATQHKTLDYSNVPLSSTVVAGPWMDPGGSLMCGSYVCQSRHVDLNFGNALHYFDFIMIEGPSASSYTRRINKVSSRDDFNRFAHDLTQDVLLLHHMRRIGLDQHVVFADKLCSCRPHLLESADQLGIQELTDEGSIDSLARQISKEGGVELEQDGPKSWYGAITHPLFQGAAGRTFRQKTRPKKHQVAKRLLESWLYSAAYDAATAQRLGVPLASLAPAPLFDRTPTRDKLTVDDVGAQIRIPVLEGLLTKELIALRNQEYHHFEQYRAVLREAIAETIDKADSDSPSIVAEQVWQNKVRPAVANIERKIAASNRSLRSNLVTAGTFGAIAGTVGAVAGLPWLVGIGLLAASTPLPQFFKSRENREKIELEEMYFLWKVKQHHGRR